MESKNIKIRPLSGLDSAFTDRESPFIEKASSRSHGPFRLPAESFVPGKESSMRYEDEFPRKRDPKPPPDSPEPKRSGSRFRLGSQFLIGAAIVIVGAALLLDNLGVMSSREILRFWPAFLVVVGVRDLFAAKQAARAIRGTLLVAFGALLLLNNLDLINVSIIGLWPLFLILFGGQMLMNAFSSPEVSGEGTGEDEEFDDFAVLGGVKRSIRSTAFRGGSASAFMGGVDLDLTKARMQGDRAVINIFALMGGVVLRIPEDWAVVSNITALMGGVDDKTRPPTEPVGTLVLEGSAVMGGIEIKD
jgi:predicted membrane protein